MECPDLVEAESVGIYAIEGSPVPKRLQQRAAHFAVDTSDHCAKRMSGDAAQVADVVLALDASIFESIQKVYKRTQTTFLVSEFLPEDFNVTLLPFPEFAFFALFFRSACSFFFSSKFYSASQTLLLGRYKRHGDTSRLRHSRHFRGS